MKIQRQVGIVTVIVGLHSPEGTVTLPEIYCFNQTFIALPCTSFVSAYREKYKLRLFHEILMIRERLNEIKRIDFDNRRRFSREPSNALGHSFPQIFPVMVSLKQLH